MDVNVTPKQLERLRRASDITEIQMLIAKFVENMSKMDARANIHLFAEEKDASIELAECGGYDGFDHVRSFLEKYGEGSRTFLLPIFRKNGQIPKKLCPLFPICSGKT